MNVTYACRYACHVCMHVCMSRMHACMQRMHVTYACVHAMPRMHACMSRAGALWKVFKAADADSSGSICDHELYQAIDQAAEIRRTRRWTDAEMDGCGDRRIWR